MLIINGSLKLKKRHVVQIYFFESCAVFFNVHLSKLFRKMILENGFGHVCWLQITVSWWLRTWENPRNHVMTSMKCHEINPSNASVLRMVQFRVTINIIVILHVIHIANQEIIQTSPFSNKKIQNVKLAVCRFFTHQPWSTVSVYHEHPRNLARFDSWKHAPSELFPKKNYDLQHTY